MTTAEITAESKRLWDAANAAAEARNTASPEAMPEAQAAYEAAYEAAEAHADEHGWSEDSDSPGPRAGRRSHEADRRLPALRQ